MLEFLEVDISELGLGSKKIRLNAFNSINSSLYNIMTVVDLSNCDSLTFTFSGYCAVHNSNGVGFCLDEKEYKIFNSEIEKYSRVYELPYRTDFKSADERDQYLIDMQNSQRDSTNKKYDLLTNLGRLCINAVIESYNKNIDYIGVKQ